MPESPAERAAEAGGFYFPSQGQTVVLGQCQHKISSMEEKRKYLQALQTRFFTHTLKHSSK